MIQQDLVEAVIGLGKNLLYGSSMECCLLVCRKNKSLEKGKILFIDGKSEIKLERSDAYLKEQHIKKISEAYRKFEDVEGFAKVLVTSKFLKRTKAI